jgi:outer membrane protein assembly factor BamB
MPLDDGGVAIVSGHEVEEFDADGHVREEMRVPERTTGALVATLAGTVATTAQGAVYLVKPGHVKSIGSLGGDPSESGASTADGRTLWAVVDHQRVVALDTSSGAAQVRFSVTDQSLHGPVVFGPRDALVFTTWTGVLIMLTPNGDEMRRTVLEPRLLTLMTDAGRVDFAALEESPPPLTDEQGRTAFARVGGRIGVVGSDGNVNAVSGGACNSPAALAPAGPKRMVVGCRDGTVLLIGDDAP